MRRWLAGALALVLAGAASAHGPVAVSSEEATLCVCTATTDDLGLLDPCERGEVLAMPAAVPPAPADHRLVLSVKLRRLIDAVRRELADPTPYP